jgi:hypothetical protein
MDYPGRIIKLNEPDTAIVGAIADRLRARGIAVTSPPGRFDGALKSAVKLFQSLHHDSDNRPLSIDGEVGPMTWGALFGVPIPGPAGGGSALALRALAVAVAEIGTMEVPAGSNRGPRVEEYLASTGTAPGNFWCMAFVHFCFRAAAADLGVPNRFPRTAGCIDAWNRSSAFRITKAKALERPELVVPGSVFILDHGSGKGHTGLVEAVRDGALTTIEGNSNPSGSSNGIGVFRLSRRNIANRDLRGFIILP